MMYIQIWNINMWAITNELRLILFVQVYSIYFKITEESPSTILSVYNRYIDKCEACYSVKTDESNRMQEFILYGRIGEKDDC